MTARQFAKHRETFCLASAGSDEEFRAYLSGFDAAVAIADLAAVPAQVRGKPLVFNWRKDADSPNPSCWCAKGDGYYAYVLIPFDAGCNPAGGVGTWNANPNHRGMTGFKSREDAMAYCENSIHNQAQEDLGRAMRAIATWGVERPDPRDEVIARLGPIADLLPDAVAAAEKAMQKYPQPNYVISKWAEETGEVTKDLIHMAEGRQTVEKLRGEIVQSLAMLHRLLVEGDQVHGLPPICAAIAAAKAVQHD